MSEGALISLETKKASKVKSVCCLLDASSSMASEAEKVQAGVNSLLAMTQLEAMRLWRRAGIELYLGLGVFPSLTEYSEALSWNYDLAKNYQTFKYQPVGFHTPLYEAVDLGIDRLDACHIKGDVVFEIISDGGNTNRAYGPPKEKVLAKIAEGWTFIFIGEGIDAIRAAEALGIPAQCRIAAADKAAMIAAQKDLTKRVQKYLVTGDKLLLTFGG